MLALALDVGHPAQGTPTAHVGVERVQHETGYTHQHTAHRSGPPDVDPRPNGGEGSPRLCASGEDSWTMKKELTAYMLEYDVSSGTDNFYCLAETQGMSFQIGATMYRQPPFAVCIIEPVYSIFFNRNDDLSKLLVKT